MLTISRGFLVSVQTITRITVLEMISRSSICLLVIYVLTWKAGTSVDDNNSQICICCNKTEGCQSLDSVLSELLPSNSVLELTNGSCNLTHSLSFTRVSNITIRGQGSQYTHISCHHMNAGLVFNQSSNIELRDFTIDSCGVQISLDELTDKKVGNASKSIVFMNTTNVVLQELIVTNSNGYGLMISDCFGSVLLNNTIFENNKVIESELEYTHGGGGLVIVSKSYGNRAINYTISYCIFRNNSGNTYIQNKTLFTLRDAEKGGGIKLLFLQSKLIFVEILSCYFSSNAGTYGGGLYVKISGHSRHCRVFVSESIFSDNRAQVYGGGGADVGFSKYLTSMPQNNTIKFESVLFYENIGYIGGGASVYSSSVEKIKGEKNIVIFENCNFTNNSATGSAAMDIRPDVSLQRGPIFITGVLFKNANFMDNKPLDGNKVTENAVFLTSQITVKFSGDISFSNNGATSLYSASALLEFTENTTVKFWNNNGERGGAVLLAGDSRMQLGNHTHFEFVNNTASYGGAICALPTQVHGFTFTDICFLYPVDLLSKNITFKFLKNTASTKVGNDIFATSLAPCLGICQFVTKRNLKTSDIFMGNVTCIGNFTFAERIQLGTGSISTCPEKINVSSTFIEPIPGFSYKLNIVQIDEMGNTVGDMFTLTAKLDKSSIASGVSLNSPTIVNNLVTFYGEPGVSGTLTIENSAQIPRKIDIGYQLSNCPPGFVIQNKTSCKCSALSNTTRYYEITYCENYSAMINLGNWVGYIGNESEHTLYTGNCVAKFCNFGRNAAKQRYLLPKKACLKEELEELVCGKHRRGVLCTICAEGFVIHYHSQNFDCYNISTSINCSYGIPLYIISELVPVTVLFLVILIFNISLTSGALCSFVFYAQVLDSQFVDAFGTVHVQCSVVNQILNLLRIFYGFFNLNMFNIEGLSFCLVSGANVMDIFMFNYATILYSVMLVIATILVLRLHSCYCCVKLGNRCGRRNIRGSIVDGLSAFLVLCYFQCTRITYKILTNVTLSGKNEILNKTVPLFLGDYEYFGPGHLPYAIPAVFVLIVVIIPPPCILMLEPVLTKLFSWNCWNIKVTHYYTKVRMSFMPFLDSFQGCFKDKYRFIAGLYFAYRASITAAVISPTIFACFVRAEILLFCIVFLHVLLRPYKIIWHGYLEIGLLINLLFVNTATLLNYAATIWGSYDSKHEVMMLTWLQIVAMFMPILYLAMYTIIAAYRNVKQFFRKSSDPSQPLLDKSDDSMGFPARLLYSKELEDNYSF